jgi:hypothetical protein
VNRNASDVVTPQFHFSTVQARTNFETNGSNFITYRTGTEYGATGAVEYRQDPISGRFDLPSMKASDLRVDKSIVFIQDRAPLTITLSGS